MKNLKQKINIFISRLKDIISKIRLKGRSGTLTLPTNKQELIDLLFRLCFPDDFISEISYERRYRILSSIAKDEQLITYLKNRYSIIYRSAVFDRNQNSNEYQKGVFAGRTIEILMLLNEIKNVKEITEEEFLEKQQKADFRREHFGRVNEVSSINHLINKIF